MLYKKKGKILIEKNEIISKLKELKPLYSQEGFIIKGLFGSYSRDEATQNSDIDILIETTPLFLEKYKGLRAFTKLEELKTNLENIFQKNVDIVDKQGLIQKNNTYILNKAIYV